MLPDSTPKPLTPAISCRQCLQGIEARAFPRLKGLEVPNLDPFRQKLVLGKNLPQWGPSGPGGVCFCKRKVQGASPQNGT